jgi:endoglucanase
MDFLNVSDGIICDSQKKPVHLHGVNIGGWMNMENFINGYSGSESALKTLMARELGVEKTTFFFDRMLDYFFNEEDVRFLHDSGVNVIRLPLNYRHFEKDDAPYEYLEKGFQRLDKVLDWCEKYNVYVLLDLHSVQGWQNCDWHCDNSSRITQFWTQKVFQDRFYALWQEIARRYRDRAVVAAYNLINEPLSNAPFGRFLRDDQYQADWDKLNSIYQKAIQAIRKVDAKHILMLEGDYYSVLFEKMDRPSDPNLIFSSHNYIGVSTSNLDHYPIEVDGTLWNKDQVKEQFAKTEAYRVTQKYQIPLLVGEFGFSNSHATGRTGGQIYAFSDQIKTLTEFGAHWTFWTYKDISSMGWIQLDPESDYMHTIRPMLQAKEALRTDFGWLGGFPGEVEKHINGLSSIISSFIPEVDSATNKRYFAQAAMSTYTADQLQWLFVDEFRGKSEKQLDKILQSLQFENCIQNTELNQILKSRFAEPAK